jgi:hypothetical protein
MEVSGDHPSFGFGKGAFPLNEVGEVNLWPTALAAA